MKRFNPCCLLILLFLFAAAWGSAQNPVPEGFTPLFNGKDFSGWNISPDSGAWKAENGTMHCFGKPNVPYVILTEKKYENFELMLEFKMSPRCNSGVMLHQAERGWGRESRIGMEIQVGDDAGKEVNVHSCGAVYNVIPPLCNAVRPAGHWNAYHITLDWPVLQIRLNGQWIQNVNLENHPQLKHRLRSGYIGLQNHGREVEYRNIHIRELPSKGESWTELFNREDLKGWTKVGNADWTVENGVLVATGGSGYLVSEKEAEPNYELQIFAGKYGSGGNSGVFYNWENEVDRGYKTEFFDWGAQNKMEYDCVLTQIIDYGSESTVILNGIEVQRNTCRTSPPKGRIALYHSARDGKVKIAQVRIKPIAPLAAPPPH